MLNNLVKKREEITLLIYSNSKDAVKGAVDDVEKMWKDRIAKLPLRDKGPIKELDPQMVNVFDNCEIDVSIYMYVWPIWFLCVYVHS